ncbi:aminotransferase class V-fold PLP-dependent enzyme [Xenorhabdus bovienii]|nr:aminotransferase class V-fold PLP-dependent enzyme [Xenorhabdus bovienii]
MNTAGSGVIRPSTYEIMKDYLFSEFKMGTYEAELKSESILNHDVYNNCEPEDVVLFTSATDAWINIIRMLRVKENSEVWVSDSEYAANIIYFSFLSNKYNVKLRRVPSTLNFTPDLEWMKNNLSDNVSICGFNNSLKIRIDDSNFNNEN